MDSNNLYSIIAIILFIYLYFNTNNDEINTDGRILIEINGRIIKADSTYIYNHLNLVKINLMTLNKLQYNSSSNIENLTLQALIDLDQFKTANNFAEQEFHTHDEFSILGKQHENHQNILRSDLDEVNKLSIVELILNLDIALLLIKRNLLNGKIILTNLHSLIRAISNKSHGDNYLSYDEIFNNDEENEEIFYNVNHDYSKSNVGKTNRSNDVDRYSNDQLNLVFNANQNARKLNIFESNTEYNTQLFGSSGIITNDTKNKNKHYVPFYNIEKIKNERKRNRKLLAESHGRESLRNDYGF